MMIEKKKLAKKYWFVCDEVETGAQLVIFQKNIKNLHVTGQLLSIILYTIIIIWHTHTQITWGNLSFQVLPPQLPHIKEPLMTRILQPHFLKSTLIILSLMTNHRHVLYSIGFFFQIISKKSS